MGSRGNVPGEVKEQSSLQGLGQSPNVPQAKPIKRSQGAKRYLTGSEDKRPNRRKSLP